MDFYLGTHLTGWLATCEAPLFVSHRRLAARVSLPMARGRWALDSGGYSELSMFGEWRTSAADYAAAVRRYKGEVGPMDFAAPQDWMCEPWMVEKTGLAVAEHQRRTVDNYLDLRSLAPELPIIPVLQGWEADDYLRCADMYEAAGVDLTREVRVGVGSVCRRQATRDTEHIVVSVASLGIALHGFGVKTVGLDRYGYALASADSMAWSYAARNDPPLPGCTHGSCANCVRYALRWRERVVARLRHQQPSIFWAEPGAGRRAVAEEGG